MLIETQKSLAEEEMDLTQTLIRYYFKIVSLKGYCLLSKVDNTGKSKDLTSAIVVHPICPTSVSYVEREERD